MLNSDDKKVTEEPKTGDIIFWGICSVLILLIILGSVLSPLLGYLSRLITGC
ncbi:MAG: hypothetical protein GQ583_10490 [Methyloprofundus sp.]|nr:hypothetical protein [Methyloprofundus sp.]